MKRILFILFTLLLSNNLEAQVKVIDEIHRNISTLGRNTIYEIKADQLIDNRIKITFRADTSGVIDLGQIYLKDFAEFDKLHQIIIDGFQDNKDQTIIIDLGDSRLEVHYLSQLFGGPLIRFSHSYNNALYLNKISKRLNRKDINRLFDKG